MFYLYTYFTSFTLLHNNLIILDIIVDVYSEHLMGKGHLDPHHLGQETPQLSLPIQQISVALNSSVEVST